MGGGRVGVDDRISFSPIQVCSEFSSLNSYMPRTSGKNIFKIKIVELEETS